MDCKEWQMTNSEWQMFNHQKKIDKVYEKNRYYCSCGHSVFIPPTSTRTFCTYCGHWIFKNKRDEFKYRLKEKLRNVS